MRVGGWVYGWGLVTPFVVRERHVTCHPMYRHCDTYSVCVRNEVP